MGLVEGYTLSVDGFLVIDEGSVDAILDVLTPVPADRVKPFLASLRVKVGEAGVRDRAVEELYDVARAMEGGAAGVEDEWRAEWLALAEEVNPITEDEEPDV